MTFFLFSFNWIFIVDVFVRLFWFLMVRPNIKFHCVFFRYIPTFQLLLSYCEFWVFCQQIGFNVRQSLSDELRILGSSLSRISFPRLISNSFWDSSGSFEKEYVDDGCSLSIFELLKFSFERISDAFWDSLGSLLTNLYFNDFRSLSRDSSGFLKTEFFVAHLRYLGFAVSESQILFQMFYPLTAQVLGFPF